VPDVQLERDRTVAVSDVLLGGGDEVVVPDIQLGGGNEGGGVRRPAWSEAVAVSDVLLGVRRWRCQTSCLE
jgi:hypothetical protein